MLAAQVLTLVQDRFEVSRAALKAAFSVSGAELDKAIDDLRVRGDVIVFFERDNPDRMIIRFASPVPDHQKRIQDLFRTNWAQGNGHC